MWRYEYMSNWRIHVVLASPATGGKCLLKVFPRSILVIKVWWCSPHFPRFHFSKVDICVFVKVMWPYGDTVTSICQRKPSGCISDRCTCCLSLFAVALQEVEVWVFIKVIWAFGEDQLLDFSPNFFSTIQS